MRNALFALLVLTVAASAQQPVLVARSADGAVQAHLGTAEGLVVTGWAGAPGERLVLPDGAFPRFGESGDLYFERSVDDGHFVLASSTWVVRAGTRVARPVAPGTLVPPYVAPPRAAPASAAVAVCIDPGHGGSDPGAVGIGGLQEKVVNLDVGLKLETWLDLDTQDPAGGGSWSVQMTRTTDVFVSLTQRANIANAFGAQSFLSIHMNSFTSSSANGTETYCMTGEENNAGGRLRDVVQTEALAAWGLRNRGVKSANFAVLRLTAMPAALLEGGFISSPIDIVKLNSSTERDTLALHCLYALQQHHGFGRYRPGSGPATGKLRGVLYDAAAGTGVRIGGGLVSLASGSFTVTRASDGYFEFDLPPGTYAYAGTAAGFDAAESSRTVTAGGEVWGSLGLPPGSVPALGMDPAPPAGGSLAVTVAGDPGSPVVLLLNVRPGLPLVDLGFLGLGVLWPQLGGLASLPLGTVAGGGTLQVNLGMPNVQGLRLHCQGFVTSSGAFRLTNGAAFETQ